MSEINWINFRGEDSRDYGILIGKNNFSARAERDVESVSVPGRDGDVIIDNGKFKNVQISCELSLFSEENSIFSNSDNFYYSWDEAAEWLKSDGNYYRLHSSYDTEHYRLACLSQGIEADNSQHWSVGKTKVSFNCKPYRYRFDGDTIHEITELNSILINPEKYDSLPYIKITGSGTIVLIIGLNSFTFNNVSGYIECDSENMTVYKGTTNLSNQFVGSYFPKLKPGRNQIAWSGTVSKIEIKPRWRTR